MNAPDPTRQGERQGHGVRLSYYDFGRTTAYCCRSDPRFSYCAYVPESYAEDGTDRYRLLVAVHGSRREMVAYRDAFIALAERRRLIVLAPLFPAGILAPDDHSSYKMLRVGAMHYDAILLAMIAELEARYRLDTVRFGLFGFSGGAQFAQRFFYLHPDRLSALSIAAPGVVTLLDFERDHWVGVRDFAERFDKPLDLVAMRRLPVQMVVGAEDKDTWEITIKPDDPWWQPDANIAGADRPARLASLKACFEAQGIAVRHDIAPGTAHTLPGLIPVVEEFFDAAFAGELDHLSARTAR
jgi:pimeloyl-ACP methyl ester carboxylesterase